MLSNQAFGEGSSSGIQDVETGMKHLIKAAKLGCLSAQISYGANLLRGNNGIKQNIKEGCVWLKKGAPYHFVARDLLEKNAGHCNH